ncbi:MAG TPA: ATP-binding protein, partial [Kofleriaceae bacterium]
RPLLVRAPLTGDLPLAPGYCAVDFAPLDETDRRTAWQRMLRAHGFDAGPASALASRFSVGPAVMQRACAAVAAGPEPAALEPALAGFVRQHRSSRIASIATRVERLASWDDLIVPDDIADGLRELCARVQHRGTVLAAWGLAGVASTARGVTALFQGGPGTGKTMAAEVVARALGYELWRVDLSRVVSKWIGETEKNLATVFDAAEDGEIVLLFDEADSLFAKRTEVKSSHDRGANLETSYLLQRLDAFTGIAILTTNHGTAIDPAFRRRLSMQAVFPFPDEADRERLWRALLPRTVPTAGDLDLGELARRFQLTGGYIRNAVLRAAYLAASRGTPLSTADLERAVRAEFLAHGKVSASGALG